MHVDGSCHCGRITYMATIDPKKTRICHCTDCQQLSGSPFRVVVPVPETDVDLLTGEPKIYTKVAESGRERQQAFCGDCGTPLYATSPGGPDAEGPRIIGLRVGAIAQRRELIPARQFWHRSAVTWLDSITDMATTETQ